MQVKIQFRPKNLQRPAKFGMESAPPRLHNVHLYDEGSQIMASRVEQMISSETDSDANGPPGGRNIWTAWAEGL